MFHLLRWFLRFLGCSTCKIGLMFLALCMGQITSLIVMKCKTKFAFIRTWKRQKHTLHRVYNHRTKIVLKNLARLLGLSFSNTKINQLCVYIPYSYLSQSGTLKSSRHLNLLLWRLIFLVLVLFKIQYLNHMSLQNPTSNKKISVVTPI